VIRRAACRPDRFHLQLEMPTRSRCAGLKLDEGDRARLKQMETGGARMSVRTWRRVRTLLLLDLGYTVTATAEALGTYRRETERIGKRYLAGGLEHALGDDPRPKPAPMLDSTFARSAPRACARPLAARWPVDCCSDLHAHDRCICCG
jgi:hypothetical protein